MIRPLAALCLAAALAGTLCAPRDLRAAPGEPPALADAVAAGELPPLAERLPESPYVDPLDRPWQSPGQYGGRLRLLMAKARDLRQIAAYGYARLVGYRPDLT